MTEASLGGLRMQKATGQGKTAAIIVIGNEVLSGKVVDQNSPYLVGELRRLGVDVQRISVIPDKIEVIAQEVAFCRHPFDWVFTTGGMGPTHDDVTMQGLSRGLDLPLVCHPVLETLIKKIYPGRLNAAQMKLAQVPVGTEVLWKEGKEGMNVPVLYFENIYIFPGIPSLLMKKFETVKERFREAPFYLQRLFIKEEEYRIAGPMDQVLEAFPDLLLGSYPILGNLDYDVMVTLESKDKAYLEAVSRQLRALLPAGSIFKVEQAGHD